MAASSSTSSVHQKHRGKTRETLEIINICQRTIKVSNIPTNLSVEDIKKLFNDDRFEKVDIPLDLLNNHLGIVHVVFDTADHCEQYLFNLDHEGKYLFIEDDIYHGPLLIEAYELPNNNSNCDRHLRLKMTSSNDSADEVATKIGKLFVDSAKKRKVEMENGFDEIRKFAEQEMLREVEELEERRRQYQEEARLAEEAARLAEEEARLAEEKWKMVEKKINVKREELKRKFGSK